MEDFNTYSKNTQNPNDLADMVKKLSSEFDGKSQNDLFRAIYAEAEKNKKNGTLTNEELDNFARMISPMLDQKQKNYLNKIVEKLKGI